jgi:hypothetical protein
MSAKLRPWSLQADLDLFRYSNYVGGLIDGIADAAQGTDRVPADVRRLYPDYHQLDVGA